MSFESGPPPGEGSDGEAAAAKGDISAPKSGVTVTADDLAEEEWGPVKEKGKVKKGKAKKSKAEDGDETAGVCQPVYWLSCSDCSSAPEASQPEPTTGDPTPGPDEANDAEDAEEGEGPKILSKKEKERLKKEKEKVNFY